MNLLKTYSDVVGIECTLKGKPFNCQDSLVNEVIGILRYGAVKHPEADQPVRQHLEHAIEHFSTHGNDESGFSNRAHSIARTLLALERMCR
jgi:hypothetical protein